MGKKSRDKGRRFELEIRKELRDMGLFAERCDQAENADSKPDLMVSAEEGGLSAAIECKVRGQQCSLSYLMRTLAQTIEQNPHHDHHAVIARLDRTSPVVILTLEQWAALYSAYRRGRPETTPALD